MSGRIESFRISDIRTIQIAEEINSSTERYNS